MAEDTKSLKDYGVKDTDIFLVLQDPSVPVPNQTTSTGAGSSAGPRADEIEQLRQRLINDPVMLQQLVQSQPAVADAALNNPQKFKELMLAIEQERRAQAEQQMQQLAALEADPFDVEAQKKIEELIKQQNIQANMEAG
jgi:DNA damage-inducible protein 1